MAEESAGGEEEVRRVFDALEALKSMEDPKAQAKAITTFLKEQQARLKELSEIRRAYVLGQRAQKVTRKQIASDIGASQSTVQDIELGYTRSGRDRPPTGKRKRAGDDTSGADS
ncbi:helix-turn-helix domain-containing protein [Streptomyces sp. NPDC088847]|uniref:helix-turn-helix domain-containing protein n=1 Tax=Streptomyces sp. NPDC088847 TaxID=3365909 RepID=UPI0038097066